MNMNWQEIIGLSMSPWVLVVRGTLMYWFLFLIFRFLLRRDVGSVAIADILLLVLIADASQNAMAGEYKTVSDGMVLVGTIVGWNLALDWLSFRFAAVRKIVEPRPLLLVDRGRLQRHNMRREFITREELMSKLRENGIENLAEVKKAYLETDGELSVIEMQPSSRKGDQGSGKPKAV